MPPEHNRTNVDFRQPLPRPPVRGAVIDFHCHLLAARHANGWFEAAKHYGIDAFVTMTPLEEVQGLIRDWGDRLRFIAVPKWDQNNTYDDWARRIDAFYNLGSRIIKFHQAPRTIQSGKWRLDRPEMRQILRHAVERGMIVMTHVGDPDTWYNGKYAEKDKFGTREEHYKMWEEALASVGSNPWVGAHMGGNPEDLNRLQSLLDRYPNLSLDCSATRWMVREISRHRNESREFFIRNQDRIIFGTDQVSGDDRGFDFLASRFWCHRKLWETDFVGPSPIYDPDVPENAQPTLRGLSLPADVIQKIHHDNAVNLLSRVGMMFDESLARQ